MAYPLICANVFTFGGVKITPRAEVLNRDGYVIPGLYAAGEMTGFYYGSDVGSTSSLRAMVFGQKAGENAGKYCLKAF
jgi:tricarballylate dehydrogenase